MFCLINSITYLSFSLYLPVSVLFFHHQLRCFSDINMLLLPLTQFAYILICDIPLLSVVLILLAILFITIIDDNGMRLSPCLMPFSIRILSIFLLLFANSPLPMSKCSLLPKSILMRLSFLFY